MKLSSRRANLVTLIRLFWASILPSRDACEFWWGTEDVLHDGYLRAGFAVFLLFLFIYLFIFNKTAFYVIFNLAETFIGRKIYFVGCVKMTERKQWKNMYLIKSTLLRRIPKAHYLRKNLVV